MTPIEWVLVLSLLFGGYEYTRAEKLEARVVELEIERDALIVTANNNSEAAAQAAEIAHENRNTAVALSADLNTCVEDLRAFNDSIRIFESVNKRNKETIEALEKRTTDSSIDQCVVPDWLVDEATSYSD